MERTWLFTLNRPPFDFLPGQYVHLSPPGFRDRREFSIASPVHQKTLEVLITRQDEGAISPLLCDSPVGAQWELDGPHGDFWLSRGEKKGPVFMIATGSGISPFASLIRSFSGLDYHILHGLPEPVNLKKWLHHPLDRYTLCASRSEAGDFQGRVTKRLSEMTLIPGAVYMLCGNSDMIFDAMAILQSRGIESDMIKAEIYF